MQPNDRLRLERERREWSQATHEADDQSFKDIYHSTFLLLPLAREMTHGDDLSIPFHVSSALPSKTGMLDPALPPPPFGNKGLIGRDAFLKKLKQFLYASASTVVLHGLPGVGKTALATVVAHDQEVHAHFPDGVLWAGLGPSPNIQGILSRWGVLLGLTPSEMVKMKSREEWMAALSTTIGTRRMLLIIDDVWEQEDIQPFLVGLPSCVHLVTTRLAYLATAETLLIPELNDEDGVTFLAQFVPDLVARDMATALALHHLVGGLPLALLLIGKYLQVQVYSGQPRRLLAAVERLYTAEYRVRLSVPLMEGALSSSPIGENPLSLQSVIAMSDQHLNERARIALRILSLLPARPNSFTEKAALVACQVSLDVLSNLRDAGLLEKNTLERYTIHQTIADYARIDQTKMQDCEHLIKYYISYVEEYQKDYKAIEQEFENIVAILSYAASCEWHNEFVRGTCAFAPFLSSRGLYSQEIHYLQEAHDVALSRGDVKGLVNILRHLGEATQKQGDYTQAMAYLDRGLALARQVGNQEQIARLLIERGMVAYEQGDYEQAENSYQEGLLLARECNDYELISALLKNLGIVALERGNYTQAEAFLQEGLTLAHQLAYPELISLLFLNLGAVALEQGYHKRAEAYLQEGLTLARQIGHRERISVLLSNLGVLADRRGHYKQAEAYLQEGLTLARQIGHRERISLLLLNSGVVADRQGHYKQAEAYLQEGLTLARQIGHRERISLLLLDLGAVVVEQGHYAQAEAAYLEGLALARQIGHNERISDLLLHLAAMLIEQGNYAQAELYLQEGLALARQIRKPHLICMMLSIWGELHLQSLQYEAAAHVFQEMLHLIPEDSQELLALAQYGLARALVKRAREDAIKFGEASLALFEALGHRRASKVKQWLSTLPAIDE